jgi:FkbM family methyltransferase
MSNLFQKCRLIASNRAIRSAYVHWIRAKLTTGLPPVLKLGENVKIGGWISFFEYFSCVSHGAVPEAERLFLRSILCSRHHPCVAFDIGANLGMFTCLLAEMGAKHVHAFEPIPDTFCRFRNNVKANGYLEQCHLNCMAAGHGRELVTFHIREDSPATNRMAMPGKPPVCSSTSTQVVASIDLDGYCQSQGVEFIDFLKIDVEGMEPYVLQGAEKLLKERKIAVILIEICPVNLKSVGLSPADLYREFETYRYSPYVLNDNGRPGARLSLTEIEAMVLDNVVLLPDD